MEAVASEHIRMNGVYWGLCCLELLGAPAGALNRSSLEAWTLSCRTPGGGFSPAPGHDAHILSTLSAVQVMALLGKPLAGAAALATASYVARLQRGDGSFAGDTGGVEFDTRFSYAALATCALLRRSGAVDVDAAAAHVERCANADGGFGSEPGGESHAGQAFVCVAALALSRRLASWPASPQLAAWLAHRQLPGGGLNGRPEKAPDVCYSWWVLSSLSALRRAHWIDGRALAGFILNAQDGEAGGVADRPGDAADVFHTFFGVAGLALLNHPAVKPMDPVYALPLHTLAAMGVEPLG